MWRVYEPDRVSVVLGAGRRTEDDVVLDAVQADGIPVYRRRGGGGTVVLAPGQAVLAMVTEVSSQFHNREYAAALAQWFVDALRRAISDGGDAGAGALGRIAVQGVSDLAVDGRKILGSSLYRSRRILFYQASMLVTADIRLFSRYLRHPSREPGYRRGREHVEFCTTCRDQGFAVPVPRLLAALEAIVRMRLEAFT